MRALATAAVMMALLSAAPASAQEDGSDFLAGARNVLGYSQDDCDRLLSNQYQTPSVPNDLLGEQTRYCLSAAGAVAVPQRSGSARVPDVQYEARVQPSAVANEGSTKNRLAPNPFSTESSGGGSEDSNTDGSSHASSGVSSEATVPGDEADVLPATGGAPLFALGVGSFLLAAGGVLVRIAGRLL